MKLPALFGPPRSPHWATLASLASASVLCFGCESKGASEAPRPASSIKNHPPIPLPKTPEMLPEPAASAPVRNDPPKAKPRDKKDWQASCMIQKACTPEAQELPACDAGVLQRPWVDAVTEGNAVLGKEVMVSGTLGLTLIKKTGSGSCAPGACCHTLEMQIVLVGEPEGSLPLRGLTCSGDDSTLCCSVPAEGQAVVATGRLQRVGAGGKKWQLNEPKLCVIENSPNH